MSDDVRPLEEVDPEFAGLLQKVCRGEIPAFIKDSTVYEKVPQWDLFRGHYTGLKEVTMEAGRNDPCPCGSGKKFKKCCGAL